MLKDLNFVVLDPANITVVDLQNQCSQLTANMYLSFFRKCTNLVKIVNTKNLTYIDKYMFDRCNKLEFFDFPESLTYIGEYAFNNTTIKNVNIPASLKILNKGVFSMCKQLHNIDFSLSTLQTIKKTAFEYCESLREIQLP